ncbi:MAG: ATP-binding cassette domain-containing protein [Chloroflexota bacterium]
MRSVSFNLNPGERVGLVGPNGCGKTTLLRIIAGADQPDSGLLRFSPSNLRVGYLPQGLTPQPGGSIGSFIARAEGDIPALTAEVERLASAAAHMPSRPELHRQNDAALSQLTAASENRGRAPAVLAALGLGHFPLDTPSSALSGGQKTRLGLASILLSDPHLLLLDEPINHIDIPSRARFEQALSAFEGTVLIVVHDRCFIAGFASEIWEIANGEQLSSFRDYNSVYGLHPPGNPGSSRRNDARSTLHPNHQRGRRSEVSHLP